MNCTDKKTSHQLSPIRVLVAPTTRFFVIRAGSRSHAERTTAETDRSSTPTTFSRTRLLPLHLLPRSPPKSRSGRRQPRWTRPRRRTRTRRKINTPTKTPFARTPWRLGTRASKPALPTTTYSCDRHSPVTIMPLSFRVPHHYCVFRQ